MSYHVTWSHFWQMFEEMPDDNKIHAWKDNDLEHVIKAVPMALAEEMLGDAPQYVKDIWNNNQDELEQQRKANEPQGMLRFLNKENIQ